MPIKLTVWPQCLFIRITLVFNKREVKGIDSIKGFEADSDLVSLRAAIKF